MLLESSIDLQDSGLRRQNLSKMLESVDHKRKAVGQLFALAALMALGWLCMRTLRFTNDGLNLAFGCVFLLIPFFAVRPVLRLDRWPKALALILWGPLLALSSFGLLAMVSCDIPDFVEKREHVRELGSVRQGNNSVHLLWRETAGGALGPHGLGLEQRMLIVPGFYLMRGLDYFEGASEGSLSADGANRVRLHIPKMDRVR